MDAYFLKPISLSDPGSQQPSLEKLICGDGVFIENRTLDDAGKQVSYDRLWLKNLEMNNISGDFHGDGPGRLISVRRGGDQGFSMPGGPLGGPPPPGDSPAGRLRPAAVSTARSQPVDVHPPEVHEVAYGQHA